MTTVRTDSFVVPGGRQVTISASPESALDSSLRMVFHLESQDGPKLIEFRLPLSTVMVLKNEIEGFDPEDWLWNQGFQWIKDAAMLEEAEPGTYMIGLEQARRGMAAKLDELNKLN